MAFTIPRSAQALMLGMILNKVPRDDLIVRLYTNDKKPSYDDTRESYDEVSSMVYDPIHLDASRWLITEEPKTEATYAEQSFTFSGEAGKVYGYYVTLDDSGDLLWAERFDDGPYNILNEGDQIRIKLHFSGE